MTITAIIDRLDDWLNPIVVKELRQAVKSRVVIGILLLFLGVQLFLLGFFLLMREARGGSSALDWNAGNDVFQIQQGILLWTTAMLLPIYAAVRLANERADQNVDLMFISTLRPASIVWGKFFAGFVLSLLIYSTCAPFMTFTYLLRGIDIPTILTVLGMDLLYMAFSLMGALFLASLPGGRVVKFFFCFVGFVQLFYCTVLMTAFGAYLIDSGSAMLWESPDLFWPFVIFLAVTPALTLLMYFYSIGLISPPPANRHLPLRIYLFVLWLVVGTTLFSLSAAFPGQLDRGPVQVTLFTMVSILMIQFVISTCERDSWAPRVARTIPRTFLFRPLALLFYTGSAGGILFSIGLTLLTLVGAVLWMGLFMTPTGSGIEESMERFLLWLLAFCAYIYAYGMSAVLVRHYLLSDQIKPGFTWLIMLLLVGLGSSIPAVFAYVLFSDQMQYSQSLAWWMLPNPIMSLVELSGNRGYATDYQELCNWFLGVWVTLVTALSVPWFLGQVERFQPPKAIAPAPAAPAIILEETTEALPPLEMPRLDAGLADKVLGSETV